MSPGADDPCELLGWDSEFWGFPVARVTGSRLDPAAADRIDAWCAANEIRCLYFLADAGDPATASAAASSGFRFVDQRVTLRHPGREGGGAVGEAAAVGVRRAESPDLPALRAIAREAHRDTRFYFDGNFPEERCADLYEAWLEKAFASASEHVWVVDEGVGAIGYVTVEVEPSPQIGLLAVEAAERGAGIGARLVSAALARGSEGRPMRVVSQGRNVAALRLYEGHGFLTEAVACWYHRWYP